MGARKSEKLGITYGYHQTDKHRKLAKRVYEEEDYCWLCGVAVDKSLRWPDPASKSMDHVIPISLGGEPYDRDNARLAHLQCNRRKKDKIVKGMKTSRVW